MREGKRESPRNLENERIAKREFSSGQWFYDFCSLGGVFMKAEREREAFMPTANVSHVPPLAFAFTFAYIALIDFIFFTDLIIHTHSR